MVSQGFERQNRSGEEEILSNAFGGLNTTAAALNCPLEDSPDLLNVNVNDSGQLEKRKGTQLLYTTTSTIQSAYFTNMTTGLGYNFLVAKIGQNINIWEVISDTMTLIMTKSNVWSSAVASVKPAVCRTNEVEPRLIFATQLNKPVQLRFVEKQTTAAGGATSVVFSNATKFSNATTSNLVVFQDRVRVPGATVSYGSGNLTIGGLSVSASTKTIDIVLVTWQWWAEALYWYGDRFWRSSTRSNTTDTDRLVSVPESISTDMDDLGTGLLTYPFEVYTQSIGLSSYTKKTDGKPNLATEYAHSDGGLYVYSVNDYANPGPFYIVFGAKSGTTPFAIYFARRRELRFRNNTGLSNATNLAVYVNGVQSQKLFSGHGLTPAYNDVWMWKKSGSTIISSVSAVDNVDFISFETPNAGVAATSTVEIINTEVVHIGSAAAATKFNYNDGTYVPIYGLGFYADTLNGYYPGDVELYQERLVLSSFPHTPFTVICSSTSDTTVPGQFYSYFQVTDDLLNTATDPFDFTILSDPKDYLVKCVTWQDSLFLFTRYNTYRATGSGNSTLTGTSRAVSVVTTLGIVNRSCVTKTDTALLFLSDTGVHSIADRNTDTQYKAAEVSIKIRGFFNQLQQQYNAIPWIAFDTNRKNVYVGLATAGFNYTSNTLLVFNLFRGAWTKYDTPGGFLIFNGEEYVDRSNGLSFGALCALHLDTSNIPNRYGFIKFDADYYLDFVNKSTNTLHHKPIITTLTKQGQQLYSIQPSSTNQKSFPVIPSSSVNDLVVTLNGNVLTFLTDWVKIKGKYIYLRSQPAQGLTLTIEPRLPVTDSDSGQQLYNVSSSVDVKNVVAIVDNVVRRDYTNWVVSDNTNTTSVSPTVAPNVNSKIIYGIAYPSYYRTPTFLFQVLSRIKKVTHTYLSFDNTISRGFFGYDDVNSSSSQNYSEIVDVPKQRCNASMVYTRNDTVSGNVFFDLYRYPSLTFDGSSFDTAGPDSQFQDNVLFRVPQQGSSYNFDLILFNYDETTFRLNAYQFNIVMQNVGSAYKE